MKKYESKAAFTIIELMISLVIVTIILTAVAIAFDACIASYQANKDISDAVIKANQALSRITNDLRCAAAVDANSEPNSQCAFISAGGSDLTYRYEKSSGRIYLIQGSSTSHILCDGISSAVFDRTTAVDGSGLRYVKNVQIKLTVGSGNNAQKACAAGAIRRNL